MIIVEAGARADLGQVAEARRILDRAAAHRSARSGRLAAAYARLHYAYADLLLRADQSAEARTLFARAAELDTEQQTDAQQRVDELDGVLIEFDDSRRARAGVSRAPTARGHRRLRRRAVRPGRRGLPGAGGGAGAAEGIAALRQRGTRVGFVTNNAARPPAAVADHLVELGIPAAAEDVVTSAQAGAHLVLDRFGAGARVLDRRR